MKEINNTSKREQNRTEQKYIQASQLERLAKEDKIYVNKKKTNKILIK